MKSIPAAGAVLTLGTLALAGPAFAAATEGTVISVTSAASATAAIHGGSGVNISGTCPGDADKPNSITSPFFAGGRATIGRTGPQAFTATATVPPDSPSGEHEVTVGCSNAAGRTETSPGSFEVTAAAVPTTPTGPVAPAHPAQGGGPNTPAASIPPGAPDTGTPSGGAGDSTVAPAVGTGLLAGAGALGAGWAVKRSGAKR